MKLNAFLLFGCLASWWSGALSEDWWYERKKEGSTKCHRNSEYREDKICLKDGSGYESWKCTKTDKSIEHNEWVKLRTDKCEKHNKCRCWEDDFYDILCECIYSREPPSFPPTGVIRWNGTYYHDDQGYSTKKPTTTSISGEIHKDSSGRFLHKWTKLDRWVKGGPKKEVKFEIIIPVGKTLLRYRGDISSKSCSRDVVNSEGDLSIIWKKEEQGKAYSLDDPNAKRKDVDTEVWKIQTWIGQWKWIVEYDKTKDYAIPKKYWHRVDDWGDLYIFKHDYYYTPLKENDESFQLETYCDTYGYEFEVALWT